MKVIVIGAIGTIGKAVVQALSAHHEVIQVGRSKGDFQVDMTFKDSIKQLFKTIAPFGAVVSTAGQARFNSLESLSDEDFQQGLRIDKELVLWVEEGRRLPHTSLATSHETLNGSLHPRPVCAIPPGSTARFRL